MAKEADDDGIKKDQVAGLSMLEFTGALPYSGGRRFRYGRELIDATFSLSIAGKRVLWLCIADLSNVSDDPEGAAANSDSRHPGAFRLTPSVYRERFKSIKVGKDGTETVKDLSRQTAWRELRDGIRSLQRDGGVTFTHTNGTYDEHWIPWLVDVYALRPGTPDAEYLLIFNPKIVAQMQDLKRGFADLAFNYVGRITSDKQVELYIKCCQSAAFGGFSVTPEQLHRLCDIRGAQAANAAELKRYFLDPAVKRLNAVTPLHIEWFREKDTGKYRFLVTDTLKIEKANTDGLPVEPVEENA